MLDKRKSARFSIPLMMEFTPLKGGRRYALGKTINFSRDGLSFTSDSANCKAEEPVMVKFKLLSNYMYIYVVGDIKWKRKAENKCIVGIKIREVDKESRSKNLDFPFKMWVADRHDSN